MWSKVRKLPCKKAPGADGLYANVFIDTAANISMPTIVITSRDGRT